MSDSGASPALPPDDVKLDPYAALRVQAFRRFIISLLALTVGVQIQGIAVAWQLYAKVEFRRFFRCREIHQVKEGLSRALRSDDNTTIGREADDPGIFRGGRNRDGFAFEFLFTE